MQRMIDDQQPKIFINHFKGEKRGGSRQWFWFSFHVYRLEIYFKRGVRYSERRKKKTKKETTQFSILEKVRKN